MKRTILKIVVIVFVPAGLFLTVLKAMAQQASAPDYRNNTCVACHSTITSPMSVSTRFYDWHMSKHKEKGVSCEQCHGGDSKAADAGKAHIGIVPPSKAESRLHMSKLPETCGACHKDIVAAFVQSVHYQKLKSADMGPSCTTCHAHMASAVIYTAAEASSLCTHCHNTTEGLLPPRPEIPQKAGAVVESLDRANAIFLWIDQLMEAANQKKVDVSAETADLPAARTILADAKVKWHSVSLDEVGKRADEAFERGTKVKDALMKKLYR